MSAGRTRIDRYLSEKLSIKRKDIRLILARGQVRIDGLVVHDSGQVIDGFSLVEFGDRVLQRKKPVYLMMNKPVGVVSATLDAQHTTVIDLLARDDRADLHIAGRLDLNSSGLLLLTNDGRWSASLSTPQQSVAKVYRVTVANALGQPSLGQDYVEAFAKGMVFPYENLITRPAKLVILSEYEAEVTLVEGRYHQIKRMFGRFRNPVLALHRIAIGNLCLDPNLLPGQSRVLNDREVQQAALGGGL